MGDDATIVEVSLFSGKVLVTFGDGKVAFVGAAQLRPMAVDVKTFQLFPPPEQQLKGAA